MMLLDALRHNHLLRGCHEDVLARIAPLVTSLELPAGAVIFREGEPAETMYLVLAGAVRLECHRPGQDGVPEVLATVPAGEVFGDMALLDHEPHLARAVAAEGAWLGQLDRGGTEEILRLAPHVVPLNFVRAVHRRVKNLHPHFTE